ncbi:MAG: hypothetical protein ACFFC3_09170 [Candidatus Odinarchaeota archaeon]
MKKIKSLTVVLLFLISLPLGCKEAKAYPFPNVFWYYWDSLDLDKNIEWNYTRTLDNRYWVIQPINDLLDYYFLLNITIISNTTIDVFLFGNGGASNEIDIPVGTKIGIQQFSFEYSLKPNPGEGTSAVYLYLDNSDDDGRGTCYNGDTLVQIKIIAKKTNFPIIYRFFLIFIVITISCVAIIGIAMIIYILKKHRKIS